MRRSSQSAPAKADLEAADSPMRIGAAHASALPDVEHGDDLHRRERRRDVSMSIRRTPIVATDRG